MFKTLDLIWGESGFYRVGVSLEEKLMGCALKIQLKIMNLKLGYENEYICYLKSEMRYVGDRISYD